MEPNETPTGPFDLTQLPTGKAMVRSAAINAAAMAGPILVIGSVVAAGVAVDKVRELRENRRLRKSTPTAE